MWARTLLILIDPGDPLAREQPVGRALERLREALAESGIAAEGPVWLGAGGGWSTVAEGPPCVLVAGHRSAAAREVLHRAGVWIPPVPEALGLVPGRLAVRPVVLVCGADARGLAYAVLELADRVGHAEDPLAAVSVREPLVERPANVIRGVARLFTSEIADKPWFYDRRFWRRYLSELMGQRFNRFSLILGLGYNFPRRVSDVYLHFAYPFLVSAAGHHVRVLGLPDQERERNLETLQFVSEEAAALGLRFQLGLWTHGYQWPEGSKPSCTIEGLTPGNHATYCRDALATLLAACPAVQGIRPFTRYGYADFLKEGRPYGVFHRVWPGTQRLLLWGDPAMAAGFGRHSSIAGSLGVEWCEPLSFKGREGSAAPGPRDGYADPSLPLAGGDWRKYLYAYRLLGRLTYNPDASPETWRRQLRAEFGEAAGQAEAALANASRILPLVTTAHHPSACNNYYWPEMSSSLPIVWHADQARPLAHWGTPFPWRFGTVSALDPELFSSADEFVGEVLEGRRSGRYSPLDVAAWLDGFAGAAERHLALMRARAADGATPNVRRWAVDVAIQACLGRFFAAKLRAAVGYEEHVATGRAEPLWNAACSYRAARAAWAAAAGHASGVYVDDLSFAEGSHLRGRWSDRLAGIDADITAVEEALSALELTAPGEPAAAGGVIQVTRPREPAAVRVSHTPPVPFRRGDEVAIRLGVAALSPGATATARLHYRHLDQAERYTVVEMACRGEDQVATIPGSYSDAPYPLQYLFELRDPRGDAWLYPGLDGDLSNQPYFVLLQARRPA
jgi:hypothetical protein